MPHSVKQIMRSMFVFPLRAYFRYSSVVFGKKMLWNHVFPHLVWLELPRVTMKTVFGSKVCASLTDVGRYIYYFGSWEPNITAWIGRRLAAGDAFIDVGTNIGYYSLLASKLVGESGRVVAIEAHPEIFGMLEHNLKINGVRNVRALNMAAWDSEGVLSVFTDLKDPGVNTTVMERWAHEFDLETSCEVRAAPLAAVLRADEIKAARLLKIDVEGAEWHVVSGMAALLETCRRDLEIIVEVTPRMLEAEGRTCQDLLCFFTDRGFNAYRIENDYSAEAYFSPDIERPERIKDIASVSLLDQADLIFSRIDSAYL